MGRFLDEPQAKSYKGRFLDESPTQLKDLLQGKQTKKLSINDVPGLAMKAVEGLTFGIPKQVMQKPETLGRAVFGINSNTNPIMNVVEGISPVMRVPRIAKAVFSPPEDTVTSRVTRPFYEKTQPVSEEGKRLGEKVELVSSLAPLAFGVAKSIPAMLRATQPAAKNAAIRIAQGILRPTGKFAKRSSKIAEASLQEGVLKSSAERTQKASQTLIDDLMSKVDDLAGKSTAYTELKPAFRRVAATAKYWIGQGKPDRAEKILTEVSNIAKAKRLTPSRVLSTKDILTLRRSEDEALKRLKPGGGFFSETVPADIEARQEFSGGLRKILGKASPEIGNINKRISSLIDVSKTAGKRTGVSSRNNLLDIVDYGLAAGSMANPKLSALLIAKKLFQAGKAGTAKGLYKYSKFGEGAKNLLNIR